MYHGHAENEYSQKDVTDFYAKFHFSVRDNCQYSTCIPTESSRRIKHINGRA